MAPVRGFLYLCSFIAWSGNWGVAPNIGSDTELRNIDVLRAIAKLLDVPEQKAWIAIEDRSGQDIRYSLDDKPLRKLGWRPRRKFLKELPTIVNSLDVFRFS